MTYQSNFNAYVAFKKQSGLGSPASGAGGTILRVAGGTPAKLTKTAIGSKEIRRDAQATRGRHGFQKTAGGPYDIEMSLGVADDILAALLRGTWDSEITADNGDFTSTTFGANTIVWASGNPIAKGFRVNDVIVIDDSATPANNGKNLRITALSATMMTVAETLTADAGGDTSTVIKRRGRKVIMPAAGALVRSFFTVEEYDADIDQSTVLADCFWSQAKWSMSPDGLLMFSPQFIGTGDMTAESTGASPVLTNPTTPGGAPYAVLDATVRFGDQDLANLTSFDLTIDNAASAPQVAAAKKSPDVLPGRNSVSMNLSMLRTDLSNLTAFLDETGLSLQVLAVDLSAEPKNFIALNVPFFTLGGVDPSALSTAGGGRSETLSIPAELVGSDSRGAGYDATMMSIQISNNA